MNYENRLITVLLTSFVILSASCSPSDPLAGRAAPGVETDGAMAADRLDRIRTMLEAEAEAGRIGSAVALISHNGEIVFLESVGAFAPGEPMRKDAIFRLASVAKTFAATATMALYESGALSLDDPVSKFIPAYEKVALAGGAAPSRGITIRDLLTHESGLDVDSAAFEAAWAENENAGTTRDLAERMARLPLAAEPGARWNYGYYGSNYEVLAAVLEAASGKPLDALYEELIFGPLGMSDTGFFIPDGKKDRAPAYYRTRDGTIAVATPAGSADVVSPFLSAGGGVRTTAADFHRYCLMLMSGGALDGVRILSPKSVEMMMTDHVGGDAMPWGRGEYGWAFGAAVRNRVRDYDIGSAGTYGWNGGSGATYWIDRKERLIGILFTPSAPPANAEVATRFEVGMYQALTRLNEE